MQAAVLHGKKDLDNLVVEDIDDPRPSPGEAVVQLEAAAMNHRDVWILHGMYPGIRLPVVPGSDGCGIVMAVGDEADEKWVGKTVIINPSMDWGDNEKVQGSGYHILGMPANGTFAQQVCVPVGNLVEKPGYLSDELAAALPLAGLTGFRALVTQGEATAEDTILVTGFGGGVGALTTQMAVALGARVATTSSSEEKLETAREIGVDVGVNYRSPEWMETIADKTGGIDLIVDGAGGKAFGPMLNLLKPGGRVVSYGATAGPIEDIDIYRFFFKQLTFRGSTMGSPEDFSGMVNLFEDHQLTPLVDRVFALADIRAAYRRMMEGKQLGKIILRP
jgi:NADPH:quinone reductase-like Zn-dependent oxidoreductase